MNTLLFLFLIFIVYYIGASLGLLMYAGIIGINDKKFLAFALPVTTPICIIYNTIYRKDLKHLLMLFRMNEAAQIMMAEHRIF